MKLTELKRDELLQLCQQRQITVKASDTKDTLVSALIKWVIIGYKLFSPPILTV